MKYEGEAAADFRSFYGLSLYVVGGSECRWREAVALVTQLAGDPSSRLGASASGMSFNASHADVRILSALVALLSGESKETAEKNRRALMPYFDRMMKETAGAQVTPDEYRDATMQMLEQFGIDPALAEADIQAASAKLGAS